jgi:tRNA modification GTPase
MGDLALFELSPRGSGAISVLQLTGRGALQRAGELCGKPLLVGSVTLARLRSGDEDLDEALVVVHGEDAVELHLHGSPPLVARIFSDIGLSREEPEARTPEERAEALLEKAPGEDGARILLDQVEGALRRRLEAWRGMDDDELQAEYALLTEDSRVARYALEPPRVLLAGPVNAGKSTLFNVLVGSERVICSPQHGTTRDLVLQRTELAGWPVDLLDSAGLWGSVRGAGAGGLDPVEAEGRRLARRALEEADIVFLLEPPLGGPAEALSGAGICLPLATKGDLPGAASGALSAAADPGAAAELCSARFRAALALPVRAWSPGRGVLFDPASRSWLEGLAAADLRAAAAAPGFVDQL